MKKKKQNLQKLKLQEETDAKKNFEDERELREQGIKKLEEQRELKKLKEEEAEKKRKARVSKHIKREKDESPWMDTPIEMKKAGEKIQTTLREEINILETLKEEKREYDRQLEFGHASEMMKHINEQGRVVESAIKLSKKAYKKSQKKSINESESNNKSNDKKSKESKDVERKVESNG